jgi:hypothetical protein
MECIKKYKNYIFATIGIFLAVCGIAITIAAVLENKKAKTLIAEDCVSEIEV